MICYFLIPKKYVAARRYTLMAFSFIFYACGEFLYFFAIFFCVLITWALSRGIADKKKLPFFIALAVNIGPLIIFKYLNFIILNINLIPFVNIPAANLTMPIGISFYTFQMLTYIVDLYGGKVSRQKNFGYLALYIFLFPQLIAGPIVRYQDVEIDIGQCKESWESAKIGGARFIKGLAKKVIIANQVCYICDTITAGGLDTISTPMMWLAVVSFMLQVYFDFSGYSDMAIGLGKMFGFDFHENFNLPFSSVSVSEFWRRWHISMGTFFRDYVYIPLGGSRVSTGRWMFNTLVVWVCTGLWHGAAWNYVLWGLYYALVLMAEKIFLGAILKKIPKFFGWCYTIFLSIIGYSIFMSDSNSIAGIFAFTLRLFGIGQVRAAETVLSLGLESYIPYILLAVIFGTPIRTLIGKGIEKLRSVPSKLVEIPFNVSHDLIYITSFVVSIGYIIGGSYNPFLYFRF